MRSILFCLLFLAVGSVWTFGQAPNDSVESLARQVDDKLATLLSEMERKVKTRVDKFVIAVKKIADSLSQNGDQTNAAIVGDYLRKIENTNSSIDAVDVIIGELQPLATGVHESVVEFEDEILAINKEYAAKIAKLREPVIQRAKLQLQRHRGPETPAAQRLREFYHKYISVPNPRFDDSIPVLPKDEAEAKLIWTRTHHELKAYLDRDVRRETWNLFAKLHELQLAAKARGDHESLRRLEEIDVAFRSKAGSEHAFATAKSNKRDDRDKISMCPNWQDVTGWLSINAKRIPASIAPVFQSQRDWCDERTKRYHALRSELNKRWAVLNAKLLEAKLLSDAPLKEQFREAEAHFRLLGERPAWLRLDVTMPLPDSIPEVQQLLNAFDKGAKDRLAKVDQEDAILREGLVAKLKGIQDANAEENQIRLKAIDTLTSDYAAGIRGTLIVEADPRHGKEAYGLLKGYCQATEGLRSNLQRTHLDKLSDLRMKIKPKRTDLVKKNDFEGAVLLDHHLQRREPAIPPIWIRVGQLEHDVGKRVDHSMTYDALLYERGPKGFAVNRHVTELWLARSKVVLDWDEIDQTPKQVAESMLRFHPYQAKATDPASKEIADDTRVKVGDKVLAFVGGGWTQQVVADLSPFGIVINEAPFGSLPSPQTHVAPALRLVTQGNN